MEKPVIDQLICAVVSMGGGIGFGVIYDFFKTLRLRVKSTAFAAVSDICVCVLGLSTLFMLFMSVGGGQARIYIALCAIAGAAAYFVTASPVLLDFFAGILGAIDKLLHLIVEPFKALGKKLKSPAKKTKKFFQIACKRFTIMVQGKVAAAKQRQAIKKEQKNEVQIRRNADKNRHSRAGDIRGNKPVLAKKSKGSRTRKNK